VNEDVLLAIIRRDEAEAFGMIEEFYGAGLRHGKLPPSVVMSGGRKSARPGRLLEEQKQTCRAGVLPKPSRFAIHPKSSLSYPGAGYSSLRAGKCPKPEFVLHFRDRGKQIFRGRNSNFAPARQLAERRS
jgi:hypothetical protein